MIGAGAIPPARLCPAASPPLRRLALGIGFCADLYLILHTQIRCKHGIFRVAPGGMPAPDGTVSEGRAASLRQDASFLLIHP